MSYSVYARGDSPFWWINYYDRNGHRQAESSRQRRDDPLGYKRALDLARTRDQKEHAAQHGAAEGWKWVTPWLELRFGAPTQATTLRAERYRWQFIEAFLREKNLSTPADVAYAHGAAFIDWRIARQTKRAGSGYNNALTELRFLGRALREAVRRGLISASPLERMGFKLRPAPEKPEMTDEEIRTIREALRKIEGAWPITKRWMTVSFEIALHQGCRLTETSIPLGDIDEAAGTLRLKQKGNRVFTTQLHPELRQLIAGLRSKGAKRTCIFPAQPSRHWSIFFRGRVDRGHERKGLLPHLCFHCTRVTAITRMARAGVPVQQTMAYVGHASETIHRIYQRLAPRDLDRCTAALKF